MNGKAYTARGLMETLGLTYKQTVYWAESGLLTPSVSYPRKQWMTRLYSEEDLKLGYVIVSLLRAGLPLQRVRKAVDFLRKQGRNNIWDAYLITDGEDIFELRKYGVDVISLCKAPGQRGIGVIVLWLPNVERWIQKVVTQIEAVEKTERTAKLKT